MKTNKSRQSEFKKRMRDSGLIQCAVWIPENKKNKLLDYVKKLKDK